LKSTRLSSRSNS